MINISEDTNGTLTFSFQPANGGLWGMIMNVREETVPDAKASQSAW